MRKIFLKIFVLLFGSVNCYTYLYTLNNTDMSNTYFNYSKTEHEQSKEFGQSRTTEMELSLTAFCGKDPNSIQLTISTHVLGISSDNAYITLNEKEQDELIAGIMERRCRISATGYEKSEIHPA